jgi:hypothetical protein
MAKRTRIRAMPGTRLEWQEAVDLAYFWMLADSARQYGIVAAPEVDTARCEEILAKGREEGITPSPDAVERLAPQFSLRAPKH